MAKRKVSQAAYVKELLESGKMFTVAQFIAKVAQKTGTAPTEGSIAVILSNLKKGGFRLEVTKATGKKNKYSQGLTRSAKRAAKKEEAIAA